MALTVSLSLPGAFPVASWQVPHQTDPKNKRQNNRMKIQIHNGKLAEKSSACKTPWPTVSQIRKKQFCEHTSKIFASMIQHCGMGKFKHTTSDRSETCKHTARFRHPGSPTSTIQQFCSTTAKIVGHSFYFITQSSWTMLKSRDLTTLQNVSQSYQFPLCTVPIQKSRELKQPPSEQGTIILTLQKFLLFLL